MAFKLVEKILGVGPAAILGKRDVTSVLTSRGSAHFFPEGRRRQTKGAALVVGKKDLVPTFDGAR